MHICDYMMICLNMMDFHMHGYLYIYMCVYAWMGIIMVYMLFILRAYLYICSRMHTYTHTIYLLSTKPFWLQR